MLNENLMDSKDIIIVDYSGKDLDEEILIDKL